MVSNEQMVGSHQLPCHHVWRVIFSRRAFVSALAARENIRIDKNSNIVVILFLKIGDLIDSEIMQILPISFAKMVRNLRSITSSYFGNSQ